MKYYLVKLKLQIGEREKYSNHLLKAENESAAGKQAIINECHGEPEWENPDFTECWDCGEMIYQVFNIRELNVREYEILSNYI